jgi:hypothetical protein
MTCINTCTSCTSYLQILCLKNLENLTLPVKACLVLYSVVKVATQPRTSCSVAFHSTYHNRFMLKT